MNPSRISILGVPVDAVTLPEAVKRIQDMARSEGQFHVMTPNPEMLVEAANNPKFLAVLQSSALNLPDGIGLLWAARQLNRPLPARVTGIDVLSALCASGSFLGPVYLLGAAEGVAERAAQVLRSRNPSLVIAGTHAGSPKEIDEVAIVARINASKTNVLFVAYGAPSQDLWIARNLKKMKGVKVAMGVGGSFDFLVGVQQRAPKWMRGIGLEWLWRVMIEPARIKRIYTAVFVFPWSVLRGDGR